MRWDVGFSCIATPQLLRAHPDFVCLHLCTAAAVQFLAPDEAAQVIETDDAGKPDDDEDMGGDEPAEELTEEEIKQRAEDDAKTAAMG